MQARLARWFFDSKTVSNFRTNSFWFVIFLFIFPIPFFVSLLANHQQAVISNVDLAYETSPRGNPILLLNYNRYVRNRESKKRVFWRCTKYYQNAVNCPGSVAISKPDDSGTVTINITRAHNDICEMKREQDEQRARSGAQRQGSENASNVVKIEK